MTTSRKFKEFLKPALKAAGYDVLSADTGAQALKAIAVSAPDVVILDLGLPDMDGKDIIKEVRAWSRVPIIVLSARDRESEKIAALDLGADDYVEKPFGIGELIARIRAALRHKAEGAGESLRIEVDGLVVDTVKRVVTRNGEPIRLTPTEYDLLAILVRHAGRVVTHRQLLGSVWGPAHVEDTQYLRVFIGQLRGKIETDPANPRVIQTEPAIGYRFIGGES